MTICNTLRSGGIHASSAESLSCGDCSVCTFLCRWKTEAFSSCRFSAIISSRYLFGWLCKFRSAHDQLFFAHLYKGIERACCRVFSAAGRKASASGRQVVRRAWMMSAWRSARKQAAGGERDASLFLSASSGPTTAAGLTTPDTSCEQPCSSTETPMDYRGSHNGSSQVRERAVSGWPRGVRVTRDPCLPGQAKAGDGRGDHQCTRPAETQLRLLLSDGGTA